MILAVALVAAGVAAIVGSELLARRVAPHYVLGRTLAGARNVTIDDALAIAAVASGHYVRVHGRISSEEEFPDEHDRPLVYRRKRIEVRAPRGWRTAANETEGVPFGVEQRSSFIGVDSALLNRGLVVVPRVAEGTMADLPPDISTDLPADLRANPSAPARLVVEQVSAVEHAFVAGVPLATDSGQVLMSAGQGRPLILTTLEIDDAMRFLGEGERRRAFVLSGLLIVGAVLTGAGIVTAVISLI